MKKRDMALDFIRILATALIIFFHFFSSITGAKGWTLTYKNGTWGLLGTSIFFILSGYLLRSIYKGGFSLKVFYKKRWLSIYPAFYIAFLGSYLYMLVIGTSPLYGGPVYKLIYTVLGIDKYVNWFGITNYSTVGEWFTAVIVVLYLVYPLLSNHLSRSKITFSTILFLVYLFMNITNTFPAIADISVVNSMVMFWIGMWIAEYGKVIRGRKIIAVPFAIIAAVILIVKLPGLQMFWGHLLAVSVFLVLFILFPSQINAKPVAGTMSFLAGISYDVYLVHHFLILVLSSVYEHFDIELSVPAGLIVYTAVTIGVGYVLNLITKFVIGLVGKKKKA